MGEGCLGPRLRGDDEVGVGWFFLLVALQKAGARVIFRSEGTIFWITCSFCQPLLHFAGVR